MDANEEIKVFIISVIPLIDSPEKLQEIITACRLRIGAIIVNERAYIPIEEGNN